MKFYILSHQVTFSTVKERVTVFGGCGLDEGGGISQLDFLT